MERSDGLLPAAASPDRTRSEFGVAFLSSDVLRLTEPRSEIVTTLRELRGKVGNRAAISGRCSQPSHVALSRFLIGLDKVNRDQVYSRASFEG